MPSLQDFSAPFDPTGSTVISAAALKQLIDGAVAFATDKGIIVTTPDVAGVPDVPNANTTTKWKMFLWRRVGATSITIYTWNDAAASDATYLKWQSITLASIPDGAVTNGKIAPGAVSDDKISGVAWSKVTGAPVSFTPSGAATGDLTGTYPNPTIAANAVDNVKLKSDAGISANRAVTGDHIRDLVVEWTRHWKAPTSIQAVIQSNEAGTAWAIQPLSILQVAAKAVLTVNGGVILPSDNTIPQITEGQQAVLLAFTPKSATSILHIRFKASAYIDGAVATVMALFVGAGVDAVCATQNNTAANVNGEIIIDHYMASPGIAPVNIQIRYGPGSGLQTMFLNIAAAGAKYNGVWKSFLVIEELQGSLT